MPEPITASMLYDLVQCPKRVEHDLFTDPGLRDEVSPFVQMLWQRGTLYESEVMKGGGIVALDLSQFEGAEKERQTIEAMKRGEPLIYNGRISASDLLGIPDLLRRQGNGYIPIDIKSGRGKEGGGDDSDSDDGDEGKPKLHYAVQLALYVDVLERLGMSGGRHGIILDVRGREVLYDLGSTRGPKIVATLWDEYQDRLRIARSIVDRSRALKGALASSCKLCHWYSSCTKTLRDDGDLTLIPRLGRAARDTMEGTFPTVAALAAS